MPDLPMSDATVLTRQSPAASVHRRRWALVAFAVIAAVHLASLATGPVWLEWASKFVLVPSLLLWVALRRGPLLLLAALACCSLGDIALQFDGLFIVGMACFAAGHIGYVTLFLRSGAGAGLRRRWYLPVGYAVVWAAMVALLWPGLGALQLPVAAYSLLLTGTAVTSAGLGWRSGLGGALFFISDGLIALGLAELPQPPMPGLWIMSTYIVAQYLLASSVLARSPSRPDLPDRSGA